MVTRQNSPSDGQSRPSRISAIGAYDSARSKAAGGIEDAPLLALAGGLAAGAVLAALLPTSRKEREVLGPVADRIKTQAGDAVEAAKTAGQARLGELGLTRDKGGEALRSIVEGAGDAFKASTEAAVASIRGPQD